MARRRLGPATIEVLQAIASGRRYGFDIMEDTGLPGGTVYPALAALERDGLVSSSWAEESAGPRRRAYELTEAGQEALDDWAVVMRERARLIGEFNADYLDAIASGGRDRA